MNSQHLLTLSLCQQPQQALGLAIRERYLLWFLSVHLKLMEFRRDRIPSHLSMRIGLYHHHEANVLAALGALACY